MVRILPKVRSLARRLYHSIWFFPFIITVIFVIMVAARISGSSLGMYHAILGSTNKDQNLLLNKPRAIRSDEWVVNTQMTIAQSNNDFAAVNKNIGNGERMDVILDVPAKNVWQLFKPHNLAFYVLPFDYAFAFKWWAMAYALLMAVYFFALRFLPGKRLIASLLALAMLFSPFVQWWYQYITLAPIYYGLFIYLVATRLYERGLSRRQLVGYAAALAYLCVAFLLVQYPAFQIAAVAAVATLFLATVWKNFLSKRSLLIVAAGVLAIVTTMIFLFSIKPQFEAINNSAYPGKRVIFSGGYDYRHLLASGFSPLFQSDSRASHYILPGAAAFNQSESSNFILLLPYLLLPLFVLTKQRNIGYLSRRLAWAIVGLSLLIGAWLAIPHLDILGKLLLIDKVPHQRMILALGILNLGAILLILKHWRTSSMSLHFRVIYSGAVYACSLAIGFFIHQKFPLFAGLLPSLALSLVIPSVVALLIFNKKTSAVVLFTLFSIASTIFIHPIYVGTALLRDNSVVRAIEKIDTKTRGTWIVENAEFENFAIMAGAKSLSGVYSYPQIEFWQKLASTQDDSAYNRYAHVTYTLDREDTVRPTALANPTPDHLLVTAESCGGIRHAFPVLYIVTTTPISGLSGNCLHKIEELPIKNGSIIIYRTN